MIHDKYVIEKVYSGSVDELKDELSVVTIENIKAYKPYKKKWDDFYSMWPVWPRSCKNNINSIYLEWTVSFTIRGYKWKRKLS